MSADTDRIMDQIRVRLPGALDGAIKTELYAVTDEFLKLSNAWYEDTTVNAVAGDTEYELDPESNANIIRLDYVINGDGHRVAAQLALPDLLQLRYAPSQNAPLTARLILSVAAMTSDDLPSVPSWIWDRYSGDFVDGVLGRMMSQPAKPYSNERLGVYHLRRFRNAMADARVAAHHRNLQDGQRWSFPRGWR